MPLINDLNVDQLKLPLGFIKLPQLVFALIAFTARSGWRWSVQYVCADGTKLGKTLDSFFIEDLFKKCENGGEDIAVKIDHSSASTFFGVIAVISIAFALIALYVYLFKWGVYAGDERVPKIDLIATCVIAIWWFIATWIWWRATNALEYETDQKIIEQRFNGGDFCGKNRWKDCQFESYATYSTLTVSVLAGFGCMILWAANIYFAFKETTWFLNRNKPVQTAMNSHGIA